MVVLDHLVDLLDADGICFIPEQSNGVRQKLIGMDVIHRFTHSNQKEDTCKPPILILGCSHHASGKVEVLSLHWKPDFTNSKERRSPLGGITRNWPQTGLAITQQEPSSM